MIATKSANPSGLFLPINLVSLAFLLSACLVFLGCKSRGLRVKTIDYGIGSVTGSHKEAQAESPSGKINYSTGFKIEKHTDTLDAVIGSRYCIKYRLDSPKPDGDIDVRVVWVYPAPVIDRNGKEFKTLDYISQDSNHDSNWICYLFEEDFELVQGDWKFQVYDGPKLMYQKKFYVTVSGTSIRTR